jgi:hypothetical protein
VHAHTQIHVVYVDVYMKLYIYMHACTRTHGRWRGGGASAHSTRGKGGGLRNIYNLRTFQFSSSFFPPKK